MEVLILLALVVGGLVLYFQHQAKQKRIAELRAVATNLGLSFTHDDAGRLLDLPFALFRKGDGRGIENVMWGRLETVPVWCFDYWYFDESTDSNGHSSRSYERFTCAIFEIDASCPHTQLYPEGFLSRLADAVGFRDIELESEEFNRRFNLKSDDKRFAYALVDPQMMAWLLDESGSSRWEVRANKVLCAVGKQDPSDWQHLLRRSLSFRKRIPDVVYSFYGLDRLDGPDSGRES